MLCLSLSSSGAYARIGNADVAAGIDSCRGPSFRLVRRKGHSRLILEGRLLQRGFLDQFGFAAWDEPLFGGSRCVGRREGLEH